MSLDKNARKNLDRRDFLRVLAVLPVGAKVAGCSAYGDDEAGGCEGASSTSSLAGGHTHTVCIRQADLDNPPAEGAEYRSSSTGHTHRVSLSQADLESVAAGGSVTVTSSSDAGHTHEFTITIA